MRLNIAIFCALILTGWAATLWLDRHPAALAPAPGIRSEEVVPDFSFTALDGREYSVGDFKGRIILLNFWATWCPPCIREFPMLMTIAAQHKEDMSLIALSSDMDEDAIRRFVVKSGIRKTPDNVFIGLDRNDITSGLFGTRMLPETIVIGPDLRIYGKLIGASWTIEELDAIIAKIP